MKTCNPYYRPVDPLTVEALWNFGMDTYEIALRTGFRESEVYRHLARYLDKKWLERHHDQDHPRAPT
jgi:hypothetical protein